MKNEGQLTESLSSEILSSREMIRNLQSELEAKNMDIQQMETTSEEHAQVIQAFSGEVQNLKLQLETKNEEQLVLESEVEMKTQELSACEDDCQSYLNRIESQQSEVEMSKSENKRYHTELEFKYDELSKIQSQLESKCQELSEIKSLYQKVANEAEFTDVDLTNSSAGIVCEDCQYLESQIAVLQDELRVSELEIRNLSAQIQLPDDKSHEITVLHDQLRVSELQITNLSRQVQTAGEKLQISPKNNSDPIVLDEKLINMLHQEKMFLVHAIKRILKK